MPSFLTCPWWCHIILMCQASISLHQACSWFAPSPSFHATIRMQSFYETLQQICIWCYSAWRMHACYIHSFCGSVLCCADYIPRYKLWKGLVAPMWLVIRFCTWISDVTLVTSQVMKVRLPHPLLLLRAHSVSERASCGEEMSYISSPTCMKHRASAQSCCGSIWTHTSFAWCCSASLLSTNAQQKEYKCGREVWTLFDSTHRIGVMR